MKNILYYLKLLIISIFIIIEFLTIGILSDIKKPRQEKDNIRLFWNEFNDNYIIEADGKIYVFNDCDYINDLEDILEYNLEEYIQLDQDQKQWLEEVKQEQQEAIKN